jgi:hypothetical protein
MLALLLIYKWSVFPSDSQKTDFDISLGCRIEYGAVLMLTYRRGVSTKCIVTRYSGLCSYAIYICLSKSLIYQND